MTTWIVGDVHGCAEEFDDLIQRLQLSAQDRLISCGDLFHRGPDPAAVMDLMIETKAKFILGNHERTILKRLALDPHEADGRDRAPLRNHFPPIGAQDLNGDGEQVYHFPEQRRRELLVFLQGHSGYFLRHSDLSDRPLTKDGRGWSVVHAGVLPNRPLEDHTPLELTRLTRLKDHGDVFWYEEYDGQELILYGHNSDKLPRIRRRGNFMHSLCLDTACVYGGSLTAYAPEIDEFVSVEARRTYAA